MLAPLLSAQIVRVLFDRTGRLNDRVVKQNKDEINLLILFIIYCLKLRLFYKLIIIIIIITIGKKQLLT